MKRATYDDVLNAPENKVAEILDGKLFLSPRPAPRHAVSSSEIGMAIGIPFTGESAGLAAGGSSTSRSFTSTSRSSCRT